MAEAGVMSLPPEKTEPWDVIVIGAGPAGALSALLLVRERLRVLLVERRRFPRRKVCGGCLNARALASLERAGLGARVRALGGTGVHTLRVHQRGRSATIDLPGGLAVSRLALDEALAAAAVEAGCGFLTETTAMVAPGGGTPADGGWRRVLLRRGRGDSDTVRARVVVVADGLGHSSLGDCSLFKSRVAASSRIGVGGEAGPGTLEIEPESILMAVTRHGYAGAVEVEGGRVNIAAAVDPSFLKDSGGPAAAVHAIFDDAGVRVNGPLDHNAPGSEDPGLHVDWMGTLPLTRRLVPRAAAGLFVLGDAAGYVEPFTGEGMAWALAGAEAVVPFVKRAAAAPGVAAGREWDREYATTIGREQRLSRLVAHGLRHPFVVTLLVALLGRLPGLAAPVLAHFSPRLNSSAERTA